MEPVINTINKCNPLEKAIFYKICKYSSLSKPELLKQLNLKHATLTRAVDSLIQKDLLVQISAGKSSALGRRPKLLSVNPNSFYLIGVDISRMYLGIILMDASLQKIEYFEYELGASTSPQFIIDKISNHVAYLLEKYSIDKRKILGLGIGAVGKLEKNEGVIVYADNFGTDWSNIPIKKMLQNRLEIPVTLENGANAATFAEFIMGSASNYEHVLLVNIGVGVRCGVITDGRIVQNINNIDSTYGHIVVEPSGKKCMCGNYGCMVMYSTTKPIIEEFKKMSKLQNSNLSSESVENIRFKDVVDYAKKGDLSAINILTNAAVYMGIGLANIVSILNPEVVVLGGPIIERSDLYLSKVIEVAKARIFRIEERNITFIKSHFEKEAVSTGICAIILKQAFEEK